MSPDLPSSPLPASLRDSSDITYSTQASFEWVWELVKEEFPGANVCFDDLDEFLADVT